MSKVIIIIIKNMWGEIQSSETKLQAQVGHIILYICFNNLGIYQCVFGI